MRRTAGPDKLGGMNALPTLDIARFHSPGADRATFLAELRAAARDIGFFYVTGHGIAPELVREVLDISRRLFRLPEAEKLEVEMVN